MSQSATLHDVVVYWEDAGPNKWFKKNDSFDEALIRRFGSMHMAAARGEHDDWEAQGAAGALGLILLFDQIPRNIYRKTAHAFATDGCARAVARKAIARGYDQEMEAALRPFFYLPFEHSEDPSDQAFSVQLFSAHSLASGDEDSLKWAIIHSQIIEQFGRFPHRNPALGRETTAKENMFLSEGGFGG
jgi:uncharacterized protein (DUF924 family)